MHEQFNETTLVVALVTLTQEQVWHVVVEVTVVLVLGLVALVEALPGAAGPVVETQQLYVPLTEVLLH